MRTFVGFTAAGVAGLVLFKLLATLVLPFFALLIGLLALTVKLAVVTAVIFFLYSIFRKKRNGDVEVS